MSERTTDALDALGRAVAARRPPPPGREYARYVLLHVLLAPLLALRGLLRARKRRYSAGLLVRLLGGDPPPSPRPALVLLAQGLGETRTAARIAATLLDARGIEAAIVVQADDALAYRGARVPVRRAPFNNPVSAWLFLRRWRPAALLAIEFHEIHHLKAQAARRGILQVVVNVPLTEGEADRLRSRHAPSWRWTAVDAYLAPTEEAAARLLTLGIPPERVAVVPPLGLVPERGEPLPRAALGVPEGAFLLVAGSTYPAEEEALLATAAALRAGGGEAGRPFALVLSPRDLDRPEGLPLGPRRSRGERMAGGLLVLDTYGELKGAYAEADLAYVGGTYAAPVEGHTPVEAAAWGVPALYGPDHAQHREILESLARTGAARGFRTAGELGDAIRAFVRDPDALREAHRAAAEFALGVAGPAEADPTLAVYDALIVPRLTPD